MQVNAGHFGLHIWNSRRDDKIAKLKAKIVKLAEGVQARNGNKKNKRQTFEVANVSSSTVDQFDNTSEFLSKPKVQFFCTSEEKLSDDKKIDAFLNRVDKDMISKKIRQRNREKKLQQKNEWV
jgi:hypothetical protein